MSSRDVTAAEIDQAPARLAPGSHGWTEEERARMHAVLAVATDKEALLAWSSRGGPASGSLRNVQVAAIHAVREAYAWGREHCGGRT